MQSEYTDNGVKIMITLYCCIWIMITNMPYNKHSSGRLQLFYSGQVHAHASYDRFLDSLENLIIIHEQNKLYWASINEI